MTDAPTLIDWAGGPTAFRRLIDAFYDRVEADDLLSPLFPGGVHEEHRDHVTTWWIEVFGGTADYTARHGGYARMLAHHRGLAITSDQRLRFATLMSLAADDAELPADPEFRAAFVGYVEWGTRLALHNSQPGAEVVEQAPVPRWDGASRRPTSPESAAGRLARMPVDQSLVGREFPPTSPRDVTADDVAAFASALGGAPDGAVPPTYPIVLAFDAMNAFLASEQIDLFRIIHGEQRFAYERPVAVGDTLTATLTVASLRQIGGADIIGTSSAIHDASGALVCTAKATLVHTGGDS